MCVFGVEIFGGKRRPAAVVHKPRDVCGPESFARGLVHRREVQVPLGRMHNDGGLLQRPEIPTGYARVRDGIFDEDGGATVLTGTVAAMCSEVRYTKNVCRFQMRVAQESDINVMLC